MGGALSGHFRHHGPGDDRGDAEGDRDAGAGDRPRKVLFLTKRLYMGKDLIDDRYGRFREIPLGLTRLGHTVCGVCLSYRSRPEGMFVDEDRGVSSVWNSFDLGRFLMPGIARYLRQSLRITKQFRPDIVIGASDAFHVLWGENLARRVGAKSVIDLYDNFESFSGTKLPLIFPAFRRAVRRADLACCISLPLLRLVRDSYGRTGPTIVLRNGVRRDLFSPRDMTEARVRLRLPLDVKLVGTAGALARSRDIETLFRAMDILAGQNSSIQLAVAGPRDEGLFWPRVSVVHDLGNLQHERVTDLLNALDVVVIPNRESSFGSFCYPQKACEAVACERPFVAAAVGAVAEMFKDYPTCLYHAGDAADLAKVLTINLGAQLPPQIRDDVDDWAEIAAQLARNF